MQMQFDKNVSKMILIQRLEEDTSEMLAIMENALVKVEDDDERINVVQEIGSVVQVLL